METKWKAKTYKENNVLHVVYVPLVHVKEIKNYICEVMDNYYK